MELVVNIPDEMYEQIKNLNTIFRDDERTCYEAVKNGVPLPKMEISKMTKNGAIDFLLDISYNMGSTAMEHWNDKTGEKVREAISCLLQQSYSDEKKKKELLSEVYDMIYTEGYEQALKDKIP